MEDSIFGSLGIVLFCGALVGIIIIMSLRYIRNARSNKPSQQTGGCTSCEKAYKKNAAARESRRELLPIMDPGFNLREISKQSILLEDHLFNARKLCNDCCVKHFLTMEGLAEEAITLDKEHQYDHLTVGLPDKIRTAEKRFINGDNTSDIAQDLRGLRKQIQQECFSIF